MRIKFQHYSTCDTWQEGNSSFAEKIKFIWSFFSCVMLIKAFEECDFNLYSQFKNFQIWVYTENFLL